MLKPKYILPILFWGFINSVFAQKHQTGARPAALSNAFVSVSDSWSTFHNQATLAKQKQISGGIFYESRFLIIEFSEKAGTLVFPIKSLVSGISFYQFGENSFKEYMVGFALAKQLSHRLNIALQFDYFASRLPENSKTFNFITFEAGISYQLTQQITLGSHIFNPVKNGFDMPNGKQESPFIIRLGGNYQFEDYILVCFETEKETDNNFIVRTGLEFMPLTNLAVRLGVCGKPVQFSGGLGYRYKNISTDIAVCYHRYLGATPSISIQIHTK